MTESAKDEAEKEAREKVEHFQKRRLIPKRGACLCPEDEAYLRAMFTQALKRRDEKIERLKNDYFVTNQAQKDVIKESQKCIGKLKLYNHEKGKAIADLQVRFTEKEKECEKRKEFNERDEDRIRALEAKLDTSEKARKEASERIASLKLLRNLSKEAGNIREVKCEKLRLELKEAKAQNFEALEALRKIKEYLPANGEDYLHRVEINELAHQLIVEIPSIADEVLSSPTSKRYEAVMRVVEAAKKWAKKNPNDNELFDAIEALEGME